MNRKRPLPLLFLAACGVEPPEELMTPGPVSSPSPAPTSSPTPSPSSTPVEPSSARLRGQYVESTDGTARRLLQLTDARTGQACRVPAWTEGSRAPCRPIPSATLVYLTADCTGEAFLEGVDPEQSWHTYSSFGAVGAARLGEPRAPAVERFGGSPGNCFPHGDTPGGTLYTIAEQLRDDELPQGEITRTLVDDGRLARRDFVSDEGERFLLEVIDTRVGAACTPGDTDAGPRCRPQVEDVTHDGLHDSACDQPAILDYSMPSAVARLLTTDGGELGVFHFTPVERDANNCVVVSRRDEAGMCSWERTDLGRKTFWAGAAYPASDWPAVELARAGSTLIAIEPRSAGGASLDGLWRLDPRATFTRDGVPCGPVWMDGVLRCLPAAPAGLIAHPQMFADAECTEPRLVVAGDELPTAFTVLESTPGPQQLPVGRALRMSLERDRRAAYVRSNGACVAETPRGRLFTVGEEVPASELEELRLAR